jgi:hypothetical protein
MNWYNVEMAFQRLLLVTLPNAEELATAANTDGSGCLRCLRAAASDPQHVARSESTSFSSVADAIANDTPFNSRFFTLSKAHALWAGG